MRPEAGSGHLIRIARMVSADRRLELGVLAHAGVTPTADAAALWSGGLYGSCWHAHPLGAPRLFHAVRLTEPQITREIAAWIGSRNERSVVRARTFALALLGPAADADWTSFIGRASILVEAEKDPVAAGRRRASRETRRNGAIDLFLTLVSGLERRHIVVEAKCDAVLGPNQLSGYRTKTRSLQTARYILLSPTPLPGLRRNRTWAWRSWRGVLARWESTLAIAGDDDPVFRLFRSELFRRLT